MRTRTETTNHSCDLDSRTIWVDRLLALLARHPEQGIGADVESMTLPEQWGTYRYLKRVNDEARVCA
jgi:hypothetical protein